MNNVIDLPGYVFHVAPESDLIGLLAAIDSAVDSMGIEAFALAFAEGSEYSESAKLAA